MIYWTLHRFCCVNIFHSNVACPTAILTHWGRVTHICVSKLIIIGSDNGLSPDRCQTIIWTNAGILLIGPFGTNSSEIFIKILTLSFKKLRLKVSSAKRRPFCPGLNVLNTEIVCCHGNNKKWPQYISYSVSWHQQLFGQCIDEKLYFLFYDIIGLWTTRIQDNSYPRHLVPRVRVVLGTGCLGYELSWVRVVFGTSCPDPDIIYTTISMPVWQIYVGNEAPKWYLSMSTKCVVLKPR